MEIKNNFGFELKEEPVLFGMKEYSLIDKDRRRLGAMKHCPTEGYKFFPAEGAVYTYDEQREIDRMAQELTAHEDSTI
jgi:hypothetical protein